MKKKQIKLEVPNENAVFYAISSALSMHKLAWELNSLINIKMVQSDSVVNQDICFPTLTNRETFTSIHITIVKNKVDGKYLVKELANIDYIMKVKSESGSEEGFKELVVKIKQIPSILAIIELNEQKVKKLAYLQHV